MQQTSLRRLEEIGLNSCAPPGTILHDGWLVRLMPGKAKRARSVNPFYPSTLPLSQKIPACESLYRQHGLPVLFRITPFSEPSGLDDALAARGYRRFDDTAVETCTLSAPPREADDAGTTAMDLAPWVQEVGRLRGSPPAECAAHLLRLQSCLLPLRTLAVVDAQGHVAATGLVIVEDGWAGLFDIVTDPRLQRRGHARRLVQGLLHAAWALGARQAYLQVSADNLPARALYRQFGFSEQYLYWYRTPDAPSGEKQP